jgi:transcriptional regulator with XRE-family HTH domain
MPTLLDKNRAFAVAIGHALRTRRVAAGLKQTELARRAADYREHYWELETGKRCASLAKLTEFAEALGCKASDLIREAEQIIASNGRAA